MIPFYDLKNRISGLQEQIDDAVRRVVSSGWYIGGEEVSAFEEGFASYCGTKHCIGVGNGLDALVLSLKAMGIRPGDRVLVPAFTFIATWLAVTGAGAVPVPVDVDPATANIDPIAAEKEAPGARAIIAVHLYGCLAPMPQLKPIAKKYGLRLLEDAAQAHGEFSYDAKAGNHGDAAAFSFYPTKNLGCLGDGGAVTTNDAEVAANLRAFRNYGSEQRYKHDILGVNSRLDSIQAAVLRVMLPHLDEWIKRRREIASRYDEAFWGESSIRLRPLSPAETSSARHHYIVVASDRNHFREFMQSKGIGTDIHYPIPPYRQPCYSEFGYDPRQFPVSEALSAAVVSLPIGEFLSDAEVGYIAEALNEYVRATF